MSNEIPSDRVCTECDAILQWRGTPLRGQYRHSRPNGELYITTHAPTPRPSLDDAYGDDVGDAGTGHGSYEYHSGA